jgi:hypothetical protein
VHGEARIDAGAVDLAALLIEPAHRRAHALGADGDDVDVLGEILALRLQMRQQEAVAEAERRAGPEGGEDLLVVLGEGCVGDQQQRHVALADHLVHLAQGAVLLAEAHGLGLLHGGGAFAQADLDLDARALERLPQVLGLRRALRGPADDADLLDAVERLGQQLEEVAAALDDGLFAVGHLDGTGLENLGREAHDCPRLIRRLLWRAKGPLPRAILRR